MSKNYISDQTFKGEDFTAKELSKAEYENCTFSQCNFAEVNLSGIIFLESRFEGCDLSLARLGDTAFRDVSFGACKMLGLRFDHCNEFLLSFRFKQCILDHSSFAGLKLKGTFYEDCQLKEADFSGADLSKAVLSGCDLYRTIFADTNLEGADLRTAVNFSIDPDANRLKKARFSFQNIAGLLNKYGIQIE